MHAARCFVCRRFFDLYKALTPQRIIFRFFIGIGHALFGCLIATLILFYCVRCKLLSAGQPNLDQPDKCSMIKANSAVSLALY